MQRQHIIWALLVAGALLLTGCGVGNPKEQDELSYRKVGIQYMEKGNYESAAKAFQKALDCANGRVSAVEKDICMYKAISLAKIGDVKGAGEVYEALLALEPDNAKIYLQRGNLKIAGGDFRGAAADYKKAISLDGNNYRIYMAAYENWIAAGGTKAAAERYLTEALDLKESSGEDSLNKGKIYFLLQDYEKAKMCLSRAENEGNEEAQLYMARVYEANGEKKQAYAIYESYDAKHKKDGFAKMRLIHLMLNQREYDKALPYIEEAKALLQGENLKDLLTYEVVALEKSGQMQAAKTALAEYVNHYPEDKKAAKELVFLKYSMEE